MNQFVERSAPRAMRNSRLKPNESAIRDRHLLGLLRLAVETCARPGELFDAEWRDFDMSALCWRVRSGHSGKSPRPVPLTVGAARVLAVMKLFADSTNPRVFHAAGSPSGLPRSFPALMRRMQLPHARFSDLRLAAIASLFRRERNPKNAARIIGLGCGVWQRLMSRYAR